MLPQKDIQLLALLRHNARESLTSMSRATHIPVSTIFDKLRIYRKNHYIQKHTALIDFNKLGYQARANILFKVEPTQISILQEFLESHYNVNSLYKINNGFDFFIECIFKNIAEVETFIEDCNNHCIIRNMKIFYTLEDIKKEEFLNAPIVLST